jgi:ribosomal protein S18 acetylase RimI-like enzyme
MKVSCRRMTATRQADAQALLNAFLREDEHYLETSGSYGDGGLPALKRALGLFLRRSDLGFVWLAYAGREPAAVCVVSYAISTSIGGLVAKLDDVYVAPQLHGRGVGTAMMKSLIVELKRKRVRRIDTSVHNGNDVAANYYKKNGFMMLNEERLTLVL